MDIYIYYYMILYIYIRIYIYIYILWIIKKLGISSSSPDRPHQSDPRNGHFELKWMRAAATFFTFFGVQEGGRKLEPGQKMPKKVVITGLMRP